MTLLVKHLLLVKVAGVVLALVAFFFLCRYFFRRWRLKRWMQPLVLVFSPISRLCFMIRYNRKIRKLMAAPKAKVRWMSRWRGSIFVPAVGFSVVFDGASLADHYFDDKLDNISASLGLLIVGTGRSETRVLEFYLNSVGYGASAQVSEIRKGALVAITPSSTVKIDVLNKISALSVVAAPGFGKSVAIGRILKMLDAPSVLVGPVVPAEWKGERLDTTVMSVENILARLKELAADAKAEYEKNGTPVRIRAVFVFDEFSSELAMNKQFRDWLMLWVGLSRKFGVISIVTSTSGRAETHLPDVPRLVGQVGSTSVFHALTGLKMDSPPVSYTWLAQMLPGLKDTWISIPEVRSFDK